MSNWLIQLVGWALIATFFALYYWIVCKAQSRDPRTRGEFENPGNYIE